MREVCAQASDHQADGHAEHILFLMSSDYALQGIANVGFLNNA